MFHVGQEVEVIDASGNAGPFFKNGDRFTVIGHGDTDIIRINCKPDMFGSQGWCAYRFRPIQERKTDIGFAHEILRRVSQGDRKLIEAE